MKQYIVDFANHHRQDYVCMTVVNVLSKGWETLEKLTDDDVQDMYDALVEKEKEINEKGEFSIFSPEFCRDITADSIGIVKNVSPVELISWLQDVKLFKM